VPSLYLQLANRCSSPIKGSRTNPNDAKAAKPSGLKAAGVAQLPKRGRKRKRLARSAGRKPQFPSGQHKAVQSSAESASRHADRWEQPEAQNEFIERYLEKWERALTQSVRVFVFFTPKKAIDAEKGKRTKNLLIAKKHHTAANQPL
jgi:hypothetical protein